MKSEAKTALITGASRGLGRALAERAAALRYRVFAGVRSEAVATTFVSMPNRPTALPSSPRRTSSISPPGRMNRSMGDAGPLSSALHVEHMTLLWIKIARVAGNGPNFVWAMLER